MVPHDDPRLDEGLRCYRGLVFTLPWTLAVYALVGVLLAVL